MKIIFYISGLSGGGAERVLSNLANYLANSNFEVVVITSSKVSDDFYFIDNKIKRISLFNNMNLKLSSYKIFFNNLKSFRKIVKDESPDIIVSFMSQSNIFSIFATLGLDIPIIISERNNPKMNPLKTIWKIMKELTFPFADSIVVQTERVKNEYSFFIRKKIIVIKNPIDTAILDSIKKVDYKIKNPSIVALGRLHKLKGMDLLIRAFAIFQIKNPQWHLTIIGEGDERNNLENLIESLDLTCKIHMPGKFNEPLSILKEGDIYVLPSRTEGFPNALCEAMSIGLPSISFDCPVGPAEIIKNDVNGILVEAENIKLLASSLDRLANNKKLRDSLSREALKLRDQLDITIIANEWIDLFKKFANK